MAETVLYQQDGEVVTITLNRPDALNSINRQLRRELDEAIMQFDQDPDTRVAIITGAGRAFCAGRDLKERASDNAAGVQARASDSMSLDRPYMWSQTWKPLIAAINGFALAGGWSIAQMCDLRLASEDAKLGISEAQWSLLPPFAATLPKMLPMAAVMELVLTADPITAQRAYDIGFVNKVVTRRYPYGRGHSFGATHRAQRPAVGAVLQGACPSRVGHERPSHMRADLSGVRQAATVGGLQGGTEGFR